MKYYKIRFDAEKSKSVEVLPSWEYDTDAPTSQTNLPEIEPVFANIYVTEISEAINHSAVSYTHLTLPTIA